MNTSETSRCRARLTPFCSGYGVDVGYGGDKITPSAISVDLPMPYTNVGGDPLNLGGVGENLYWFRDGVLDFVFSSHLLEDYPPKQTADVIREWLRVLKIGGHLIRYLPHEMRYRAHCKKTGQSYNFSHKAEDMSLPYIQKIFEDITGTEVIHTDPSCEEYSFEIVVRKTKHHEGVLVHQSYDSALIQAYEQRISIFENSLSWKVTYPLRVGKRYARMILSKIRSI